jgi:hypothetical protein
MASQRVAASVHPLNVQAHNDSNGGLHSNGHA